MNGNNRYIFDTNAIIALLRGNASLSQLSKTAHWIGISVIAKIEFLAFSQLAREDITLFSRFQERVDVLGIDNENTGFIDSIIHMRTKYNFKIPDAIIAATSIASDAQLVTADKELHRIDEVAVISFS